MRLSVSVCLSVCPSVCVVGYVGVYLSVCVWDVWYMCLLCVWPNLSVGERLCFKRVNINTKCHVYTLINPLQIFHSAKSASRLLMASVRLLSENFHQFQHLNVLPIEYVSVKPYMGLFVRLQNIVRIYACAIRLLYSYASMKVLVCVNRGTFAPV